MWIALIKNVVIGLVLKISHAPKADDPYQKPWQNEARKIPSICQISNKNVVNCNIDMYNSTLNIEKYLFTIWFNPFYANMPLISSSVNFWRIMKYFTQKKLMEET